MESSPIMCPYCEAFLTPDDLHGITGWCLHYQCSRCQRPFVTSELLPIVDEHHTCNAWYLENEEGD